MRPKNKNYIVTFTKSIELENCSKKELQKYIDLEKSVKYALEDAEVIIKEVKE